jgi:hypothetical protein
LGFKGKLMDRNGAVSNRRGELFGELKRWAILFETLSVHLWPPDEETDES